MNEIEPENSVSVPDHIMRASDAPRITPMELLAEAMRNPDFKPEMLDRLMDWQERYEKTQARKAFDEAMAQAMAEIPVIRKNRKVDFVNRQGQRTHYSYEDLSEVLQTVKPILAKYGLTARWRQSVEGNQIIVTCVIAHRQGHYEENSLPGPRDMSGNKNEHQQTGSGLTYLQRYTLKAALGLAASEDDDGQAAGTGGEDTGPISEEQAAELTMLISETGANQTKFLQYFKIADVPDLPASKYESALKSLQQKKAKA